MTWWPEMSELAETIIGTYRAVTELRVTRWPRPTLNVPTMLPPTRCGRPCSPAGVPNVEVVTEAEAAAALARSVGADAALPFSPTTTPCR